MRLPLLDPAKLSAKQRPLYDNMRAGIEKNFQGFKAIAPDGTLLGPWNPWLHEPKFGKPLLYPDDDCIVAIASDGPLPQAPLPVLHLDDIDGIANAMQAEAMPLNRIGPSLQHA